MKASILILFIFAGAINVQAQEYDNLTKFQKHMELCHEIFQAQEQKCPDRWSMKCYNHLLSAHKNVQECYKKTVSTLLQQFYDLSADDANNKFNEYADFIHQQYLFIFNDTTYCKKNNCGVSPYLYSEYAATQSIKNYVNRIINAVSARD